MYSVNEISIAAYNHNMPEGMTHAETCLYLGIKYAYDLYRAGYSMDDCNLIKEKYIKSFEKDKEYDHLFLGREEDTEA